MGEFIQLKQLTDTHELAVRAALYSAEMLIETRGFIGRLKAAIRNLEMSDICTTCKTPFRSLLQNEPPQFPLPTRPHSVPDPLLGHAPELQCLSCSK